MAYWREFLIVCFSSGVSDVDYSLYPDRELQGQWLRAYLEAYKEYKGFGSEVTEKEVETLFIQVNQFALVSLNRINENFLMQLTKFSSSHKSF